MIPTAFEYSRATTVEDAIAKLGAAQGGAKLIAGGHSLVPLMKLRLSEPQTLIDIARIPGLAGITRVGDKIEIGAGTVYHDVATSSLILEACPVLAETAAAIGDPQVRNRGTLGGSLAHADPSADFPAVMVALEAEIHVRGPNGPRVVEASDFFLGLFTVDLAADELIVAVQFTPVKIGAYEKLYQRASHFAIVGVAAALVVEDGTIATARIGLTGAGSHATRLTEVEDALAGKAASIESIDAAAKLAGGAVQDFNSDLHASAEYRRAMVPVYTERALRRALGRAQG